MLLFVISFEYLAKLLMSFSHTRHFCPNFPFSPKICQFLIIAICQDFPLSPYSSFWKTFDGFLPVSPICHFRENCQLPINLFCCPIYIFSETLDESLPIHQFRKICHFRKTHDHRHASFFILF